MLAQAVAGLERMAESGFVASCGAWGNPQHAHPVNKLRIVLVESSSDFSVHVLGQGFECLGFLTPGLDRVDKLTASGKLLVWGSFELVVSCQVPHLFTKSPRRITLLCCLYQR